MLTCEHASTYDIKGINDAWKMSSSLSLISCAPLTITTAVTSASKTNPGTSKLFISQKYIYICISSKQQKKNKKKNREAINMNIEKENTNSWTAAYI